MTKYNILGGGQIEALTDFGIIEALRAFSQDWIPTVGIEDFMEGMAQRCTIQLGVAVRTDSMTNFVADLKQYEFITPHL